MSVDQCSCFADVTGMRMHTIGSGKRETSVVVLYNLMLASWLLYVRTVVLDDLCPVCGAFGITNIPWCHVITDSVTSKTENISGLHTACMVVLWK